MKSIYKLLIATLLLFSFNNSNAQWRQSGPDSSQVQMLKYVNGNLFAYTHNPTTGIGYLYLSINGYVNWQRADSATFAQITVNDITYDSAHSIYVIAAAAQNGIYYSSDGLTWSTYSGNIWNGNAIAYIHNQLVLTLEGGVGISTDGGQTWNASNAGLYGPFYVHYVTRIGDTLYLFEQGSNVCFVSGNYGATWQSRSDSIDYAINCFYEHNGSVYAGLYLNGVADYQPALGYWQYYNAGLPLAYQGVYVSEDANAITDNGDTLFMGADSIGVWMNNTATTNGWQDFSCGLPEQANIYKLVTIGNLLYAATDDGVWTYQLNISCVATGLPVVNNNYTAEVFPTITDGLVNIRSEILPETIHVLNSHGQLVQVFDGANTSINIGNCAQGLYFIQMIWPNGQTVVRKVMKQTP